MSLSKVSELRFSSESMAKSRSIDMKIADLLATFRLHAKSKEIHVDQIAELKHLKRFNNVSQLEDYMSMHIIEAALITLGSLH